MNAMFDNDINEHVVVESTDEGFFRACDDRNMTISAAGGTVEEAVSGLLEEEVDAFGYLPDTEDFGW